MNKTTKIWVIVAVILIAAGFSIFAGVMSVLNRNPTEFFGGKYETNSYEINEAYHSISILSDTAHIVFVPAEDPLSRVICYEEAGRRHTVAVLDGTLTVRLQDTRKWYEYLGIQFSSPKITLQIPSGKYSSLSVKSATGATELPADFSFESVDITQSTGKVDCRTDAQELRIHTTTGSIHVKGLTAGTLELSVSTGTVTVADVTCQEALSLKVSTGKATVCDVRCGSFTSQGSTGKLTMKDVIAADTLSVQRSTGDVSFEGCDAGELTVKTSTGDVCGSLLSGKRFFVHTDTGKIRVPQTSAGGQCRIETDTGDIRITIE